MQNFEKAYKELNAEQKRAVMTTNGPVLVVAGPGTGKTQLLSMRVAHIMSTTDTDPSQILCLTFTNKAAANMRDRLQQIAGPETRFVVVKTFHSFAAEIMQRFPEYFWHGASLSVAPDAAQLEIIEDILKSLPLDNPLAMKFAGQYTQTRDVKNALKLVKEAGLTSNKLRAIISYNLAYIDLIEPDLAEATEARLTNKQLATLQTTIHNLPADELKADLRPLVSLKDALTTSLDFAIEQDTTAGKTTHTSAWKRRFTQTVDGKRGMHDERKRNNWWLLIADVYEQYRKQLHLRGYYDYADMLVEVISQLDQNAELRASVQEQFLYVLIDEFQDTNAAQLRLAHLVADHHLSEGAPNIMAVGDDDQTIYKFNGAELNNMLGFTTSYPSTELVILEQNYRSNQQILDTAERIISLAEDRLVKRLPKLSKNLVSSSQPAVPAGEQRVVIYHTQDQELSSVADELQKLSPKQRAETAVLARNHDSLERLAYICTKHDIALRYERSNNVLDNEAIRQFNAIAMTIVGIQIGNKQLVSQLLQQSLRHPMWDLKPSSLWELAKNCYPNGDWLAGLLESHDKNFEITGLWLQELAAQSSSQPLALTAEYILGLRELGTYTSPIKAHFTALQKGSVYLETLSAFGALRQMVQEISHGNHTNIADWVRLVDIMQTNQQIISDDSPFVNGEGAVELMTIHKAKGLEFERVYILDCVEANWRPRAARRRPPVNLPLQPNGDDEDDYVRLLYVAATRAKQHITFCSYHHDAAGNEVVTSPLALAATSNRIQEKTVAGTEAVALLEEHLAWPRLETSDEKLILKDRLEQFSLNVTALINFLDVPHGGPSYFLERNLLRLPEAKTDALAFGTAIHSALETAQQLTNQGTFALAKVQTAFETALNNEHLPELDHKRRLEDGQKLLDRLIKGKLLQFPKGSKTEVTMSNIMVGNAVLGGSLDRVDVQDNGLLVIDYKTGGALSSLTTQNASQQIKAWKHRTQLIFYAILLKHSAQFKNKKDITGQMIYVQAENPKQLAANYTPTGKDIEQLETLSQIVWQKVRNLDLPDTSKYPPDMTGIEGFIQDLLDKKI